MINNTFIKERNMFSSLIMPYFHEKITSPESKIKITTADLDGVDD